ncbi:MAG: hypothetical protein NXY59_00915 [Aigarchaeota archaeon]|nr:hypothetical protein [Candidatus Pelearchaeum maunauluense]
MSRIRPLNLPLSIYLPNKKLASLAVELRNVPGALMEDLRLSIVLVLILLACSPTRLRQTALRRVSSYT